jgi:dsDNA-specific endonuclease/ATPase MutS2
MAFNQISNGINGGITEINKQKEELQAQITNNESVIAEIESSEKNDKNITEINQQLEELKGTNEGMMTSITNMETKITEMEESIPPFIIMYIGSLIKTIIAGFIIIGIVQPIYLNMLLKKFDVLE